MKITIDVTADDIKKGSTYCSTLCPVTRAMARAVGLPERTPQNASRWEAMTQPSRLLAVGRETIMCDTPPEVRDRIIEWDARGKMDPFTFSVETTKERPHYGWIFPGCFMPSPVSRS